MINAPPADDPSRSGIPDEVLALVASAAVALERMSGGDVQVRFTPNRRSGGAWLVNASGLNADVGVGISQRSVMPRFEARLRVSSAAPGQFPRMDPSQLVVVHVTSVDGAVRWLAERVDPALVRRSS